MSDTPHLLYFDVRGRGEPIRLILEEMGEPWEERTLTLEEWFADPPPTPFDRMPVYREGAVEIPEQMAILYYLGRKHGLLGCDEAQRIRCDVTVEIWRDYGTRLGMVAGQGAEAQLEQFFEEQHPQRMGKLEAWYESRDPASDFWAGSLTIADFVVFAAMDDMVLRTPERMAPFASLMAFYRTFRARPAISGWLESPRRQTGLSYGRLGRKEEAPGQ